MSSDLKGRVKGDAPRREAPAGGSPIDLFEAVKRQGQWDAAVDGRTRLMLSRAGLDAVDTMMVIADVRAEDDPLVFANGYFLTFTGYDGEEVLGRNCRFLQHHPDGTHDDDQPGVNRIRQAIRKGIPTRALLRNYRKDGELFWNEVFLSPVLDDHGRLTHMIGVQNDVSERMDAEEDRHLLHSVVHDNEDAMMIAAAAADGGPGVVTHVNRAFLALTGLDRVDVVGRGAAEAVAKVLGEKASRRALPKLLSRQRYSGALEIEPSGGCPVWVRYSISPVRSRGNRVAQWCHVFRDLSEQHRLEQEVVDVVRREQSRMARDLHDSVAQDLAASALACALLRDSTDDESMKAELRDIFEGIRTAADQARSIAHGLMPDDVRGRGLAASLARLARRSAEYHELNCEFHGEEVQVEPDDAVHLYYIAREALSNAVRHGRADRIVIRLNASEGVGTLAVSDDGIGFSDSTESDGIGTRTMRSRARLIYGELHVRSGPGGGTEVRCEFPVSLDR